MNNYYNYQRELPPQSKVFKQHANHFWISDFEMEIENRNLPKKNYDFFLMLKQINQIENTLWSLRDCMF